MLQVNQIRLLITNDQPDEKTVIQKHLLKLLHITSGAVRDWHILKKSLDARKKPQLYWVYSIALSLFDAEREKKIAKGADPNIMLYHPVDYRFPDRVLKQTKEDNTILRARKNRPIIVGTGPAGLLCGYMLSLKGLHPILLERGKSLKEREAAVNNFWQNGILDPDTNIQFGEGGAGTFSDGKLQTQVRDKTGRIRYILKILVEHGAPEEILYLNKPHIGTEILSAVVENLRNHMRSLGAEFFYETKLIGLLTENGRLTGVRVCDRQGEHIVSADCCILCIGHSARDTFSELYRQGVQMENKPFAVGLRVQHSQSMINEAQYGTGWEKKHLPPADYKLTCTTESGRGVYSFCMCPGGYVVNASSEPEMTAVNGMSYHGRDSGNANSAIVMTVSEADYGEGIFAGMKFQQKLERMAYCAGDGKLVLQRLASFMDCPQETEEAQTLAPKVKGKSMWGDLRSLLPDEMYRDFKEAMVGFGRQIGGFDRPDTILCGIESRTSSPVRILRDELFQSNIKGLFPCGEGAGYAGGITSAALDGVKVAEKIIMLYNAIY